jgi:hypothetical protein
MIEIIGTKIREDQFYHSFDSNYRTFKRNDPGMCRSEYNTRKGSDE